MRILKVAFKLNRNNELTEEHFGDSDKFAIYEISDDGSVKLIEYRENKAKDIEEDHSEHHGDPKKLKAVISQLHDVDVLAGFIMGPNLLRIKRNSDKVPFLTRTRDLNLAIKRVIENFNELWSQVNSKKSEKRSLNNSSMILRPLFFVFYFVIRNYSMRT